MPSELDTSSENCNVRRAAARILTRLGLNDPCIKQTIITNSELAGFTGDKGVTSLISHLGGGGDRKIDTALQDTTKAHDCFNKPWI